MLASYSSVLHICDKARNNILQKITICTEYIFQMTKMQKLIFEIINNTDASMNVLQFKLKLFDIFTTVLVLQRKSIQYYTYIDNKIYIMCQTI